MSQEEISVERRSHPRYRVSKNAVFIDKTTGNSLYCKVLEMSALGAKIRLAESFVLSDRAELVVISESLCYDVSVRWRSGNLIGLQFEGEPKKVQMSYK
jgi:hypothetical protein